MFIGLGLARRAECGLRGFRGGLPMWLVTELQKISNLKRTITYKLAEKISDGHRATSFKDFTARLRQMDVDLRHFRRYNQDTHSTSRSSSRTTTYSRGRKTSRSLSRRSSVSSITSSHPGAYPEEFKQQLRQEGRCLKCMKRGHLPTDDKAPCKNNQSMTYKEAKATRLLLAKGMARCHEKEWQHMRSTAATAYLGLARQAKLWQTRTNCQSTPFCPQTLFRPCAKS